MRSIRVQNKEAQFHNLPNGCRISHRELVTSIEGALEGFKLVNFAINPGLAATFPWLATQAKGWEQYRFLKLVFEYVTRASDNSTGFVLMGPDYDASDPPPATEEELSTYEDSIDFPTKQSAQSTLDPKSMFSLGSRKFTRDVNVRGTDIKTYDAGNFYVMTAGQGGGDKIGKLYVSYIVEFYTPHTISTADPQSTESDVYVGKSTPKVYAIDPDVHDFTIWVQPDNVDQLDQFKALGTTVTRVASDPSELTKNRISFPKGAYLCYFAVTLQGTEGTSRGFLLDVVATGARLPRSPVGAGTNNVSGFTLQTVNLQFPYVSLGQDDDFISIELDLHDLNPGPGSITEITLRSVSLVIVAA